MEFDNSQVVKHLASLPPEPPKREERSAWGAPFRAIKAAVADVMGSGADTVKGMSAGRMVEGRAPSYMNPLMGMPGDDMGAVVSPGSIDRGSMFRSDVGRSFRNVAEELRPDPATASTAENVVFGVVRPLAKLAAGGMLAGPAGLGLASAEEGFTQSEDLARQGVDVNTRSKVGTLTAGVTAATAGLPMAGSTLKATAALYLAGGPGGFMAQQAATRSILADANYEDLAKQYDPLDPLGLAVSTLIPLPFAAYGARANIRGMRKAQPDATPAPAAEPAAAPARTQDDIDAAMAHNLTLRADVHEAAGKSPEVLQELARVDSLPIRNTNAPMPEEPTPGPMSDARKGVNLGDPVADGYVRLYHGGNAGLSEIKGGTGPGNIFGGLFTSGNLDAAKSHGDGSTYAIDIEASKILSQDLLDEIDQADIAAALKKAMPWLDDEDFDTAYKAVVDDRSHRVDEDELMRIFREDSVGQASWEAQRVRGELAKQLGFKAVEMNDEHGTSFLVLPGSKVLPLIERSTPESVGVAMDAAPPANDAAVPKDAGKRSEQLTDKQITDTEPATIKPSTDPMLASIAERVATVEAAAGDLVVRTTEDGRPVTVADELAAVRREAAEGTDAELGALDADLVRVAAECALSMGST